jgi:hypothetical protein
MTITPKQRKIFWLSAISLAAIYYAPSIIMTRSVQPVPRPSPFAPAGPVTAYTYTRPVIADTLAVPFRDLIGQYGGRGMLPSRGICLLKFEIRPNRERPGALSGYSTLTCAPVYFQQPLRPGLIVPKVTSAIYTGIPENGAINFQVDDSVTGGCPPTETIVKRFGANQIVVEFKDCHGRSAMTMGRVGR